MNDAYLGGHVYSIILSIKLSVPHVRAKKSLIDHLHVTYFNILIEANGFQNITYARGPD